MSRVSPRGVDGQPEDRRRLIVRLIDEAGGDDRRLLDLLAAVRWKRPEHEAAYVCRLGLDCELPWPQPGTKEEISWAEAGGLISRAVRDAAYNAD